MFAFPASVVCRQLSDAESDSNIDRKAKGKVHEMIWHESSELRSLISHSVLKLWQFKVANGDLHGGRSECEPRQQGRETLTDDQQRSERIEMNEYKRLSGGTIGKPELLRSI
jgi:hypothetical protein